jgi:hypothetical protein
VDLLLESVASGPSGPVAGSSRRRLAILVVLAVVVLAGAGLLWAGVLERGDRMQSQPAVRVDPEVWAKLDPTLRQAVASLNADPTIALPVVIALAGGPGPEAGGEAAQRPGREGRIRIAREREAAFTEEVDDLRRELGRHGATEIQPSWLNRTVSARVALPGIEAAARRPETEQIVLGVRRRITA